MSLVSFNLEQFFSLPLSLMTLTFLKTTRQLFYIVFLTLGLSNVVWRLTEILNMILLSLIHPSFVSLSVCLSSHLLSLQTWGFLFCATVYDPFTALTYFYVQIIPEFASGRPLKLPLLSFWMVILLITSLLLPSHILQCKLCTYIFYTARSILSC